MENKTAGRPGRFWSLLLPFITGPVYVAGMKWIGAMEGLPQLAVQLLKLAATGIGGSQILLWVLLGRRCREAKRPFAPALAKASSIYIILGALIGLNAVFGSGQQAEKLLHRGMEYYCVGLFSLELYPLMPVIFQVSTNILTGWAVASGTLRAVILFWLGYYWENIRGKRSQRKEQASME